MSQNQEQPTNIEIQPMPLEKRVGFRSITDNMESITRYRLLITGKVPEKTKSTLEAIRTQDSLMAREVFSSKLDHQKFLQHLGGYTAELKNLIDDVDLWQALPAFIPPDQDTLEISKHFLETIDDQDLYPRGMSEADRKVEIEINREKLLKRIRGDAKEDLQATLQSYYDELVQLSLQGVSSETGEVN